MASLMYAILPKQDSTEATSHHSRDIKLEPQGHMFPRTLLVSCLKCLYTAGIGRPL